ncbi:MULTISPECIES: hypothetical protein [Streptomyces]|uniref:hypothetical protein n=1 Tax=Streptomyces TaxID=1883 RepID=UPI002E2C7099|nr:hypothetical protein [Streptomyces sp. NBC_00273]
MTVDPAEPDTFRKQFPESLDPEAPEADVAEQLADLQPDEDDPITARAVDGVTDGDAVEQARVVPLDEDDYR